MDPVRAGITEKQSFLRSAENCFLLAKNAFYPKKTPKISYETDFYLGKGNFILWKTFSGRGQNMLRIKKWVFLGPKSWFFA